MVTIACVLNVQQNQRGPTYDVSWVEKLYRGIKRNLDLKFDFVCLSNIQTPFNTIKLDIGYDIFWNKIQLFDKLNEPVLYFDLDVVICKNITEMVVNLPKNKFLMVKEPYMNIINSSIMFWDNNVKYLYEQFSPSITTNYSNSGTKFGDQSYIVDHVKEYDLFENYLPPNFIQWQHHKIDTPIEDPGIIIFTGSQKPHISTLEIVRNNWI
jgi:hypothetical protein